MLFCLFDLLGLIFQDNDDIIDIIKKNENDFNPI